MENRILGLHHVTAIAGYAQENYNFYTKVLGLRLVKKTVNFDDPGSYHLYYGDEVGTPGSILTFFPSKTIWRGTTGTGMATEIGYSVPKDSLTFWKQRLEKLGTKHEPIAERFGEKFIALQDSDGLNLSLIEPLNNDIRKPWIAEGLMEETATRGFHSIVLTLKNAVATEAVLTTVFGYQFLGQEGNRFRYRTNAIDTANIIDIIQEPHGQSGINAVGTNHHVAFRVKDDTQFRHFREKVKNEGLHITEKIDRNYFYSLYFREPGGVLFEIASDNPGFATDEAISDLGTNLKLPAQYEKRRTEIEERLPQLVQ
jgi:glyoxalase family protein